MHIYIAGIGGSGLSPLAQLALDSGFIVSGSDTQNSLGLASLQQRNIPISLNQDGTFLQDIHNQNPIDWFIYTSAIKLEDSLEYKFVQHWNRQNPQKPIQVSKRSDLLNFILKTKNLKLLAVAGTHGKTTTTAMLVWIFTQLQIPISYSIGTNISFGRSAQYQTNSEYFVYECDEFDRNFLDFYPYCSIITSLEFDHPDTYLSEQDYFEAFTIFIKQTEHLTVGWDGDVAKLHNQKSILTYSKDDHSNQIDILQLTGRHNRENAYLALQLLTHLRISTPNQISTILDKFPGTERRFEKLCNYIFTDYAHHPSEIFATLQMATEFKHLFKQNNTQIITVYQPHQNARQHQVQAGYHNVFDQSDLVYWLPTYLTRENTHLSILSPQSLIQNCQNPEKFIIANLDIKLRQQLYRHWKNGEIILFLGAGTIDMWARDFVNQLDK